MLSEYTRVRVSLGNVFFSHCCLRSMLGDFSERLIAGFLWTGLF